LTFGVVVPGPPFAAGLGGEPGAGVPVGGCLPFNAGLTVEGCAPAGLDGPCLPVSAGLVVVVCPALGCALDPAGAVAAGPVCCVFCVRRNPPGANGFAGGAGCGLGVTAALAASVDGNVGASTAAAAAAPTAVAATPALVPPGGGGGGAAGGGPPGVAGGIAATAAAGVIVCAWPCGLVIVTMLVVLLITT
jgi:hypothetical protein